jgi:FkbM family methyltransferase
VTRDRPRSPLLALLDRSSFRRLLRRLPPAFRRSAKQIALGDRADAVDLAYCYRLILGRSPDPAGWRHYSVLIDRGELSVSRLALAFLSSLEFRQRGLLEPGDAAVELVRLGPIELYVPGNDPAIGSPMVRRGAHQPQLAALLERILAPGMTFVDIGANIGYFSLLAARIVESGGRVVAVEPGARNCRLLHRSVVRNRFGNVQLHPCAISDGRGTLAYLAQGSNGTIADLDATRDVPPGAHLVPATTLDDLLAGLDRVDVIKLDVEGAEGRVLRGASLTLERHRPAVISEVSPSLLERISGVSAEAYLTRFLDLGYELSVVDRDGDGELLGCGRDLTQVLEALAASGSVDVLARPVG